MQILEKIERLIDDLNERFSAAKQENERLSKQIEAIKGQLQEKDLEIIRLNKEHQRQIETIERELMKLKTERAEYDEKLSKLHQKLSASLGIAEEGKNNIINEKQV